MKIFIDSAELNEIKKACEWGIIDGATTNPSLIKKAVDRRGGKISMEDYIIEILKTVPGPVSLEVIAVKADEMIEQARTLYRKFSPYGEVVIKIPINPSLGDDGLDFDGLKAIRQLSGEGIPVNCTLVMTPEQALLAAKAGAAYVSPFAGRIDDYIRTKMGIKFEKGDYFNYELLEIIREFRICKCLENLNSAVEAYQSGELARVISETTDNGILSGVDLVAKVVKILRNYDFKTRVIASSIRNARQVREVAEVGVDVATLPFKVIEEMVKHYKTLEGMKRFMADVVPHYEEIFKK